MGRSPLIGSGGVGRERQGVIGGSGCIWEKSVESAEGVEESSAASVVWGRNGRMNISRLKSGGGAK